jgi:hypothetical protein
VALHKEILNLQRPIGAAAALCHILFIVTHLRVLSIIDLMLTAPAARRLP